jgi:hypothetical protein
VGLGQLFLQVEEADEPAHLVVGAAGRFGVGAEVLAHLRGGVDEEGGAQRQVVLGVEGALAERPLVVLKEEGRPALKVLPEDGEGLAPALEGVGVEALQGEDVLRHAAGDDAVRAAAVEAVAKAELVRAQAGEADEDVEVLAGGALAARFDVRPRETEAVGGAGGRGEDVIHDRDEDLVGGLGIGVEGLEVLVEAMLELAQVGGVAG